MLDNVQHPRLFHREALSLSSAYRVVVAAAGEPNAAQANSTVTLVPLEPVSNRGVRRLLRIFQLLRIARQLRPAIVHLHSIETLVPLLIFKPNGSRVVFDRHEDYPRNILYGMHWPSPLRRPLASLCRQVENWASKRLDGVIYAESAFEGRLALPAERCVVVENRYCGQVRPQDWPPETARPVTPVLLLSGTIAEEWGALRCVTFWRLWNEKEPARLKFIGRCQSDSLRRKVERLAAESGLENLLEWRCTPNGIDFDEIEEAIANCTLGLALYRLSPARADRTPTRFFEYMAWRKPLLFTAHRPWEALNDVCRFGLSVPDEEPKPEIVTRVVQACRAGFPECFDRPLDASAWHWSSQEQKLLDFYSRLLASPTVK